MMIRLLSNYLKSILSVFFLNYKTYIYYTRRQPTNYKPVERPDRVVIVKNNGKEYVYLTQNVKYSPELKLSVLYWKT